MRWRGLTAAGLIVAALSAAPAAAAPIDCVTPHWVGSWYAAPTSAWRDSSGFGDASFNPRMGVANSTARSVLTPTLSGGAVRVHLSNRFGAEPVTFGHVTIARRGAGAALAEGSVTEVTFGGQGAVTVPPGEDVASDPVAFAVAASTPVAVSVYVPGTAYPTEHYLARQTSYMAPVGTGDLASETSGQPFTSPTTTRPWVSRLDVLAPAATGAVIAFGDSLTDGYESSPNGQLPENQSTLDRDVRYTDFLARRLAQAGRPTGVMNAGIGGNRVLADGGEHGTNYEAFGVSALRRLEADTPADASATTVIFLEGTNDVKTDATADAIIAGYKQIFSRLRVRGFKVLQGTLPPEGGASPVRDEVNAWIRSSSTADGVIDFDAVLRDPDDPDRLQAAYDGGDRLHYTPAGNSAMADAVPLKALALTACARPLRVGVEPRRLVAGATNRVRVTVSRAGQPVARAVVRVGAERALTRATGVATLSLRPEKAGRLAVVVTPPEGGDTKAALPVVRPAGPRPGDDDPGDPVAAPLPE